MPQTCVAWEQTPAGDSAGDSTTNTTHTRALNNLSDPSGIASLADSKITLQAGTYYVSASAPGYYCGDHVLWLHDDTTSDSSAEILVQGSAQHADDSSDDNDRCYLMGIFTITVASDIVLKHRAETGRTDGLGRPFSQIGSLALPNVYSMITITKIS